MTTMLLENLGERKCSSSGCIRLMDDSRKKKKKKNDRPLTRHPWNRSSFYYLSVTFYELWLKNCVTRDEDFVGFDGVGVWENLTWFRQRCLESFVFFMLRIHSRCFIENNYKVTYYNDTSVTKVKQLQLCANYVIRSIDTVINTKLYITINETNFYLHSILYVCKNIWLSWMSCLVHILFSSIICINN